VGAPQPTEPFPARWPPRPGVGGFGLAVCSHTRGQEMVAAFAALNHHRG